MSNKTSDTIRINVAVLIETPVKETQEHRLTAYQITGWDFI
jgi:hypothetical protein